MIRPGLCITCNLADAILRSLQDSLAVISVELTPIYEKLVTTRRQLVALAAKEGSHKAELKPIQEELRKIDSLSAHSLIKSAYLFTLNRVNFYAQQTSGW
jgi:hypothetical protein